MSRGFLKYFHPVAKNKTERFEMRIPTVLKQESVVVATIEKRSLANLIEILLMDAVEQKKATDPRRFREELNKVLELEAQRPSGNADAIAINKMGRKKTLKQIKENPKSDAHPQKEDGEIQQPKKRNG